MVLFWIAPELHAATWNICDDSGSSDATGTLYDSGGQYFDYGPNENCTFLIQPSGNPYTTSLSIWYDIDSVDYLRIYSGTSNAAPMVREWTTTSNITGTDAISVPGQSAYFVEIISDSSLDDDGFEITWTTTFDGTPPAAVTDLAAGSATLNTLTLTWTAPGDDGNSGTAAGYDVRYSTSPINGTNWASATQAVGEPSPQSAGSSESFVVSGLNYGTTYYFAVTTVDEAANQSGLSNIASGATTAPAFCGSGNLVMVTLDGTYNFGYDDEKRVLFESWGYTVTVIADGHSQSVFDNAAATNDVMFISDTVYELSLDEKARNLDIGIVVEDVEVADEMALVDPETPTFSSADSINIDDNSHYITNLFSTGNLTIFSATNTLYSLSSATLYARTGVSLASTGASSPTLYAFESGASLEYGVTAPNRRVGAHFSHNTNPANWNDNLKIILQRSLEWASCGSNAAPNISLTRAAALISDPFNNTVNPKMIPGAVLDYTVSVTNQGLGSADADTVIITNPVGSQNMLYVSDLAGVGSGPIDFSNGAVSSGMNYNFTSLASTTDCVSFSNNNGSSYIYSPTADADGYDANVTHVRVMPAGTFAASNGTDHPAFSFVFRVKVR
jgi:hypothetical protein